MLLIGNNKEII
jgi:hypothetical protein